MANVLVMAAVRFGWPVAVFDEVEGDRRTQRLGEERFFTSRPDARKACGEKSRVAAFRMTLGWGGLYVGAEAPTP